MTAQQVAERFFFSLGIVLLMYAGGTTAYGSFTQRYATWQFDREMVAAASEPTTELREGDAVGKLEIPRLKMSVMVFQGVEESALVAGAGHVPGTPSPGGDGNVVIAAHRDTYFRKLSGIVPGDRVRIATTHGVYEYVVDFSATVNPEDTQVMESRGRNELTLITCFPFYFVGNAPQRFIVHAHAHRAHDAH